MNSDPFDTIEFFMSPDGNDAWSGKLADPDAAGTDGPLKTIGAVLQRVNALHQRPMQVATPHVIGGLKGPVVVWMRGGRYPLTAPITITSAAAVPMTFAAMPGEMPVIDGGVRIETWTVGTHNGLTAWTADLAPVRDGEWFFRELFVDGERRERPRFPKTGLHRMESVPDMPLPAGWDKGGYRRFVAAPGDMAACRNLNDVEVVYVHFWIEERSTIESYDAASRTVTMSRRSRTSLVGSHGSQLADYYLDNVCETLDTPGEWYLDRATGRLTYLPLPGESPETTVVVAPRALQLLRLVGTPERPIEHVRFRGISFQHTDWRHPGEEKRATGDLLTNASTAWFNRGDYAAAGQAAADVPGVVHLEYARHCSFEQCTIRNVGWYAMFLANGCYGNRVVGCELRDLGAGGVKLNGTAADEPESGRTGWNRISDNHIHQAGRIFHSGIGILSMHSAGNVISHNHIHDLFYSGISCGWVWGYGPSVSHDNIIEKNHIHTIGQGLLSDMGGVYLLGVQAGTVVRGNVIHDVVKAHYGGWALYTDEGSSHIILENNVCYRTNGHVFHQHYGRENTLRNNILVFGAEAATAYTRVEPHVGVVYHRNIIVGAGSPMFAHTYGDDQRRIISDLNLFWDTTRPSPLMNAGPDGKQAWGIDAWRRLGHDLNSLVADPRFTDIDNDEFTLASDSPAFRLGFRPIDTSDVGPQPITARD